VVRSSFVVGLDVGTSSAKAVAIDQDGNVAASAASAYPTYVVRPGWTEQDPYDWQNAAFGILAEIAGKTNGGIEAIGLTGQMHAATFLDARDMPIRNALLWNDQRTAEQAAEIEALIGRERYISITGNGCHTGFQVPKILWVRENEPSRYDRIASVLLAKDFVRLALCGESATDVSDASGTGVVDIRTRDYSTPLLDVLSIPKMWLPKIVESPAVCGAITKRAARTAGVRPGTPIVGGAGDNAAGALGADVVDPCAMLLSLGTSGVLLSPSVQVRIDPKGAFHAFLHAVPGLTFSSGVTLAAGGSLAWFRRILSSDPGLDEPTSTSLTLEAADSPVGSNGVVFAPYLSGERAPHLDPHVRGAWVGLSTATSRADLTRAVLEGVAFSLRDVLEGLRALGILPTELRAVGPACSNPLWRSILCNVLGLPIVLPTIDEGAAFGAAILAAVGAGWYADVRSASTALVRFRPLDHHPDADEAARYDELYLRFIELYPRLHALV